MELFSGPLRKAEEEGRLRFDGAVADACLAYAQGLSCDEYRNATVAIEAPGACGNPFIPLVEDGGDCATDLECIGGNCVGASIGGTSGKCESIPGEGEACQGECQEGLRCAPEPSNTSQTLCQRPAANGKLCETYVGCEAGHECVWDAASDESRCRPYPAKDEPCTFICADGLYCADTAGGGSATCQPQKPSGAACLGYDECQAGSCEGYDPSGPTAGTCTGSGAGICG